MIDLSNNISVCVVLLFYTSFLAYLGWVGFKKTKTFSDYTIGGRSLSPFIGAMNVGASDMSSWLLMGLPSAFYLQGFNQIWMSIGLIFGSYLSWTIMARRLRCYSEISRNSITISSFLQNRFRDNIGTIRIITAIMILFFFVIYIASGFVGSAKLLTNFFGFEYHNALIFSIIVIVFYAVLGGFLAISWADCFQGMLILFALLLVPGAMFFSIKSQNINIFETIKNISPDLLNPFYNVTVASFLAIFSWGLGYFGQPHIISKYMSIKEVSEMKSARNICLSWMITNLTMAMLVGIFGIVFFADNPLKDPEMIFITSSYNLLPLFVIGILISAIMATIMSTANSQIIICCSAISEDLFNKFLKVKITDKKMLHLSRFFIIVITFVSYFFATDPNNTVLSLVARAWSGLGATIGPIMIFALFWKKTTKLGAIAGIISGGIGSIVFSKLPYFAYEILPAFLTSCLFIFVVSKFTKNPEQQEIDKEFDEMVRMVG